MATVGEKAAGFTLPSDSWEPRGLAREGAAGGTSGFVLLPRRLVERVHRPGGSGAAGELFLRGEGRKGPGDERGLSLVAQGVGRRERQRDSPAFDFQRGAVEEYGNKHDAGFLKRAYFVINKQGVVRANIEASPGYQPEVEEVLEDLD